MLSATEAGQHLLVIECSVFAAEGAECEKESTYESVTQSQRQLEFTKFSISKNGGVSEVDEKECKLDCFRFNSGQIGFVAGCLFDFWKHFMATLSSHAE